MGPTMTHWLAYSLLFSCLLLPIQAFTYPQLALGDGFQVVVIISNNTGQQWQGTARLREGNDQNWSTQWALNGADPTGTSAFEVTVAAGSAEKLVLTSNASLKPGYLQIFPDEGFTSEGITLSFFYNFLQEGQLVDSTGVAATNSNTKFIFNVEKTAAVNTGVAWAPFSMTHAFKITATLFGADGGRIGSEEITFAGHLAQFFTETFTGIQDGFLGWVRISSEENIHLTVLRLENTSSGFQLTSVPPRPELLLHSPAFAEGDSIPAVYTCNGQNDSPPLTWNGTPDGLASWALILEDPDAPSGTFDHWIVFNIPAGTRQLGEGGSPDGTLPSGTLQGRNDFGTNDYRGPCPPQGAPHRYFAKLFGLDIQLNLAAGATKQQVEQAMNGHVVCSTQLMGMFAR